MNVVLLVYLSGLHAKRKNLTNDFIFDSGSVQLQYMHSPLAQL